MKRWEVVYIVHGATYNCSYYAETAGELIVFLGTLARHAYNTDYLNILQIVQDITK